MSDIVIAKTPVGSVHGGSVKSVKSGKSARTDRSRTQEPVEIITTAFQQQKSPKSIDNNLMIQVPFPYTQQPHSPDKRGSTTTLPVNIAIPMGLAQVFLGGAMVVCGSFALRYQSYLFYYGSGLWAGTLAGITGALSVMATKKGVQKPKWLCGGNKWQIHVFLAAAMLSLTASVLVSIFSTSGLVRDAQYTVGMDTPPQTKDEETFERRKSSGIAINAILLLLALLEIILGFCSIGISLRVLCSPNAGSLLSSGSSGSEQDAAMRDFLGTATGPEYEARKDRLLRWLGHQRKNFFSQASSPSAQPTKTSVLSVTPVRMKRDNRLIPQMVALSPAQFQLQHQMTSLPPVFAYPPPMMRVPYPTGPRSLPYGYPMMVPMCQPPPPIHYSHSHIGGHLPTCERKRLSSGKSECSSSKSRTKREKKKEITEEDVAKTYTGLDREIAEDFISTTMNSGKSH